MPTVKVTANKMTDASVSFISLVDRGANRIPFKIVKQEKSMSGHFAGLDLGKLFARKSETKDKHGEVLAVVTMKGESFDSVKKQVADAGFSVDNVQEMEDGSVIFKQDGDMEGETTLVRLNDHVAVVTKGFRPYAMDITVGDGSFAEQCAAQGFYPGVRTIVDVLAQSINVAVDQAASPQDAAKMVAKMFDEAKTYTVGFLGGLPVKAFKLESVTVEKAAAPKAKAKPADGEEMPEGEMAEGEDPKKKKAPAAKAAAPAGKKKPVTDEMGDEGGDAEMEAAESDAEQAAEDKAKSKAKSKKSEDGGLTEDDVSSIVAEKVDAAVSEMAKKMDEALAAIQKVVSESVSKVSTSVEDLSGRVAKAEQKATVAESAIKGTVVHGSESGDHAPVQKSESSGVFGGRDIDTAFMPNVRKRASR